MPEQIALVLLDLTMPGLSGQETLKQMRTVWPEVPVLLSSGYNQIEAIRRFAGQALAGFIGKPYTAPALAAKVKEVSEKGSACDGPFSPLRAGKSQKRTNARARRARISGIALDRQLHT